MSIDLKTIRIPQNYVLVKPVENYSTIQHKGQETGIFMPDFIYEKDKQGAERRVSVKERNFSVYGTVYAIPEKIGFHREKIKQLNKDYKVAAKVGEEVRVLNRSVMDEIGRLTDTSCLYETECEVNVGDKVKFSYLAHKSAKEKRIALDTEEGEMYLIKYDMLTMVVNEDLSPKTMLNGYILIEPEEDQSISKDGAMNYKESETGLILPTFKHNLKRNRKNQIGTVKCTGNKVGGYLQVEDGYDPNVEVNVGDRLIYDPRGASRHEHHYHQEYSDKPLQLIQRRDIWLTQESAIFDKVSIDRKK